jgi:alginate O-acetyltransferase complex protein AlgJ
MRPRPQPRTVAGRLAGGALRAALDVFLVAGFLAAIGAPAVMTCIAPTSASVQNEFRQPPPLPRLPADLAALDAFPKAFDEWFKDSFWPRPLLIRWHSIGKLMCLNVSPHPTIEAGKAGWLFLGGEASRACTRGTDPFTEEELERWVEALEQRDAWCRAHGAEFLFVIAPNKATVYPEYLPRSFEPVGPTRFDQLLSALRARTQVQALDLRPCLAQAKEEADGEIYYPLGTHWNARGAVAAYRDLLEWIGERYPDVAPAPPSSLTWRDGEGGDNWAQKLYVDDLIKQDDPKVRHPLQGALKNKPFLAVPSTPGRQNRLVTGPDRRAPRLFVLHDSFAEPLVALMAPHFSRSVWVWSKRFVPAAMELAQPDLVVMELVERDLHGEAPDVEAEFGSAGAGGASR